MKNHCDLISTEKIDFLSSIGSSVDANSLTTYGLLTPPPLTSDQSAGICLESALTIARQLRDLPSPTSFYARGLSPRTMPTCSCCAMQASYALLMQFLKTQVVSEISLMSTGNPSSTERLVEELRHALEGIIFILNDFAVAFEAISGMRG